MNNGIVTNGIATNGIATNGIVTNSIVKNDNKLNYSGKEIRIKLPKMPTIPNPFFLINNAVNKVKHKVNETKDKILQLQNLKYVVIAAINKLATKEGQILFKSLLKAIEPSMKLFTDEMLIQVEKNKPKIEEVLKELGQPVSQAVREAMGSIPGFGEGLAVYLALKNTALASLNGANVASSLVDNVAIAPAMKVLKETGDMVKHASELKTKADNINEDLNNVLKLFSEIEKDAKNAEMMEKNGCKCNNQLAPVSAPAAPVSTAPVSTAPVSAPVSAAPVSAPVSATPNKAPAIVGGKGKKHKLLHNSTRRIKKWVKRFTITNRK